MTSLTRINLLFVFALVQIGIAQASPEQRAALLRLQEVSRTGPNMLARAQAQYEIAEILIELGAHENSIALLNDVRRKAEAEGQHWGSLHESTLFLLGETRQKMADASNDKEEVQRLQTAAIEVWTKQVAVYRKPKPKQGTGTLTPKAYLRLAQTYLAQGEKAKVMETAQQMSSYHSKSPEAQQVIELLVK